MTNHEAYALATALCIAAALLIWVAWLSTRLDGCKRHAGRLERSNKGLNDVLIERSAELADTRAAILRIKGKQFRVRGEKGRFVKREAV